MGYITNADISERLGSATLVQLADDDGNGTADTGVIDEARLGAEAEVNSYLAARYAVPINLTVHPELVDMLASLTLDLAEDRLRSRRPPVSADFVRRFTESREWLRRLADGTVELPSIAGVAASTSRGTIATAIGEDRFLNRDELSDL